MIKKTVCILGLILSVSLSACTTTKENSGLVNPAEKCPSPRPEMCTRDYRPVCATLSDGTNVTYPNGCEACSNPNVQGYSPGSCE